MDLVLNGMEMRALYRQAPTTRRDGGWQSLLVGLQDACDRTTGAISITMRQRQRIRMYAFKYGNGGWESRLVATFGRHLGPKLDLGLAPPTWTPHVAKKKQSKV
jgi:hypothetical protein